MKKLKRPGKNTSTCEVTNVSPFGLWILLNDREYFLDHKRFPWFRRASVEDVLHVEAPSASHIRWPNLDIDVHLDSLESPEKYPLVSKIKPKANKRPSLTARLRRKSA